MIRTGYINRRRPGKPRRGRLHDKQYLVWIATLPCIACYPAWFKIDWPDRQQSPTEAAHVGVIRGLGQKASDRETVPLCGEHHRTGPKAHHVLGRNFWDVHALDREAIIRRLNEEFDSKTGIGAAA